MSFSIQAAGRVADAIEQVKAATGYGDTSQFDAARAFILAELEAWPVAEHAAAGVLVEGSGHHDATTSRNVTITIRPLHLKG